MRGGRPVPQKKRYRVHSNICSVLEPCWVLPLDSAQAEVLPVLLATITNRTKYSEVLE